MKYCISVLLGSSGNIISGGEVTKELTMGFKYIIGIPERQLQVFPLGRRWGVISSVSMPF